MWNALIHICLSRITYATGRRFCKVILSSKFLNGNWHPCRFSNVSILNTINSFLTVNSLICYFHYFAPDKRVQILKCPIFFQLSSCSLHFSEKCLWQLLNTRPRLLSLWRMNWKTEKSLLFNEMQKSGGVFRRKAKFS